LARERLKNARRTNEVRFWGVSAFFLLFLVLGGLLRLPAWAERSGRPTLRKPFRVKALMSSLETLLATGPASTRR